MPPQWSLGLSRLLDLIRKGAQDGPADPLGPSGPYTKLAHGAIGPNKGDKNDSSNNEHNTVSNDGAFNCYNHRVSNGGYDGDDAASNDTDITK